MAKIWSVLGSAICVATLIGTASGQQCAGDCDSNGRVAINELIRCVRISLDEGPLTQCEACDSNGDSTVVINELVLAVNNSLASCAGPPTGTPATPNTPSTPSTPATPATPSTPSTPGSPTPTPDDVRCCLPNAAGDEVECEDRTAAECLDQGGVDKGLGVCAPDTCADVPPPNPDVRCCISSGGEAECEDRTASQCEAEGGVNRGIGVCAPDTCDGIGTSDIQCCVLGRDGFECEDRTPSECTERGGTNMGPGTCDPDPCNP